MTIVLKFLFEKSIMMFSNFVEFVVDVFRFYVENLSNGLNGSFEHLIGLLRVEIKGRKINDAVSLVF